MEVAKEELLVEDIHQLRGEFQRKDIKLEKIKELMI
jgi:hypothetical protein